MKIQVMHDAAGNVRGVLALTGRRKGQLRVHGYDRFVAEVDVPELPNELSEGTQREFVEALTRCLSGAKVASGRLVREPRKS